MTGIRVYRELPLRTLEDESLLIESFREHGLDEGYIQGVLDTLSWLAGGSEAPSVLAAASTPSDSIPHAH